MRALILVGGLSTRLMPLSKELPKSLVEVGGRTLLARIIDSLTRYGVNDVIFLTGYLGDKVESFVKETYPDLKTVFVPDPPEKDPEARYIYSMAKARDALLGRDILYLHGDLFFDAILTKKLLDFPNSAALVKKNFISPKDFNARVENGLITKIGVHVFDDNAGFCLPFYKFLGDDFTIWMDEIVKFVEVRRWSCYAEDALNKVLDKIKLYPVYFDKEYGMEIDDFEDLKNAEKLLING